MKINEVGTLLEFDIVSSEPHFSVLERYDYFPPTYVYGDRAPARVVTFRHGDEVLYLGSYFDESASFKIGTNYHVILTHEGRVELTELSWKYVRRFLISHPLG